MSTVTLSGSEYLLGADEPERSRLLLQAEIHRPQAERLLRRISVPAGGTGLDSRCGPLGILDLLSAAVGPAGRAPGIDNEPDMIAPARQTLAPLGLTNAEVELGDAGHPYQTLLLYFTAVSARASWRPAVSPWTGSTNCKRNWPDTWPVPTPSLSIPCCSRPGPGDRAKRRNRYGHH